MIATSIEQSKKLVELGIDPSTADMCYKMFSTGDSKWLYELIPCHPLEVDIPAWSLSALLELMPSHIDKIGTFLRLRMDKSEEGFNIWYEDDGTGLCVENSDIIESTPIDVAFEMVCWLKENKHI